MVYSKNFSSVYAVQKFIFFEIVHLLGLPKNGNNVSVVSKMQMFTKIISLFVFKFLYWLGNPIGT